MIKSVFFFPGVGSQYVGMSKTLYQEFPVFKQTIEEASDLLKINIADMCFVKENKNQLDQLENAQSIILAMSTASFRVFQQEIGITADYCLGHSLGEYSALCSAGVFSFQDAIELVRQRGLMVTETVADIDGTMMWVINLDIQVVEEVCQRVSQQAEQSVYVSAYDSPTQSSISGHTPLLMKAAKQLEKAGAIVYPLKFSGPFHCPLMLEAQQRMKGFLETIPLNEPQYTVIANHNARPYQSAESVPDNLSLQLASAIRWRDSINYLLEQGVRVAVEMGPKNVLKFLTKKNTADIFTFTTDSVKDFDKLRDQLVVRQQDYLPMMGKCLGAAVSVKNGCPDNDTYETKILKPYRKIEALYNEWKTKPDGGNPPQEYLIEAVTMLQSVFTEKQVSVQEQYNWFQRIFENKVLKKVFPVGTASQMGEET